MKFFVQNPSNYKLWRYYRASLIKPILDKFRDNAHIEDLNPTFWLHYRNFKHNNALCIDNGNTLNYLVREIQKTPDFDIPVDLLCITVKYPSSKVSLGLVDLSVISPQGSGYIYNMFAHYRRVVNPNTPINIDIVDNNLGMETFKYNKNAAFSNLEYILLDTARMIAKVELLGTPSVSYADVYKYVKYIIKFYHLSFVGKTYSINQVKQLNAFINAIKQVQLPHPSNPDYINALKSFHNRIKEVDRGSLQCLSMWFDNNGLLKVITNNMNGGDGFVHLNNNKLNLQVSKTKKNVNSLQSQQVINKQPNVQVSPTIKMNVQKFLDQNNSTNVSIYGSDWTIDENSKKAIIVNIDNSNIYDNITYIWSAFTNELQEIYELITIKQKAGRISTIKTLEKRKTKTNVRKHFVVKKTTDKSKINIGKKERLNLSTPL